MNVRHAIARGREALRQVYAGFVRVGAGEDEAYAQLVLTVLREKGPLPLGPLIECVAQRAMNGDRRGGSDIDIGVWGAPVYRAKITHVVQMMVGRTLALEGDPSSPAITPV